MSFVFKNRDKRITGTLRECTKIFTFLCFVVLISVLWPNNAYAEECNATKKIVRVGWYPSDLFQMGKTDDEEKGGYSYEYLQKIASYNGWEYEYVYGEWAVLLEMLRTGAIDIMAGVSETKDRSRYMSFPEYQMGSETYCLYQHDDNQTMFMNDMSSFNGQKIGAVKDNLMTKALLDWIDANDLNLEVVYYDGFTNRDAAFSHGEIDGIVATDNNIMNGTGYSLVTKVGEEPYYLAVTKSRSDLLSDLNYSLALMDQMDPYFLQNLIYSSYGSTLSNTTLTDIEATWLEQNPTVTIGYLDDYLPYCGTGEDGKVTGLLKDVVSASCEAIDMNFDSFANFISFKTYDSMILALNNGEIDAAFPVGGSGWDQEQAGIDSSNTVITAGMNLVYKGKLQNTKGKTFAINKNNNLQYYYIKNNFDDVLYKEYDSIDECIDAVNKGEADFTVVNGLRVVLVEENRKYSKLSTTLLQKTDTRSFGVKGGNVPLLLLINRGLKLIGADYGANASYSYVDQNVNEDLIDFARNNMGKLLIILAAIMALVITSFSLYIRAAKRNERLIKTHLKETQELSDMLSKRNEEMKEVNEKLLLSKEEAEAANRSKTIFLSNMSHDIRTPMNAILGYAKLMEKKMDDPEVLRDYLMKIEKSGEYLLNIINNVLEVSRIDSGKATVDLNFVDLYDPECSVAPLLENEFAKNDLHFTASMNITHRYVFTDIAKIREINMNLMSNAIKYTPAGGNISMHFEEVACDVPGYAKYVNTITDSGIGMSKEFQEKIFDSFSREKNTTESKIIGTGLGMSIVKKLVDLLDGTIEVESEVGKGTTFKVTMLHQIVDNPESYLADLMPFMHQDIVFDNKRILLAEDNDFNAEIATEILSEAGFLVEHASDGVMCFDMLLKAEPGYYDLILMDIQMPNLDGYGATEKIREAGFDIPIFAMTANAFEEDKQNAIKAGMNGHIAKPINVQKLMETLMEGVRS